MTAELKSTDESQPAPNPRPGNEPVISITRRAPVSTEELNRIMASMGRDPDTGVQTGAARASPEPVAPRTFPEPVDRPFFPRTFPPPAAELAETAGTDSQRQ